MGESLTNQRNLATGLDGAEMQVRLIIWSLLKFDLGSFVLSTMLSFCRGKTVWRRETRNEREVGQLWSRNSSR